MRKALGVAVVGSLLFPALALAATTFSGLVDSVLSIINTIVPLLASVAVIIFLWGIVRYIAGASDSESHAKGRDLMVWGVIALFVMFSLWGLVGIIQSTFLGGA